MGAVTASVATVGRLTSRSRWLPALLLLLVAVFGPGLASPDAAPAGRGADAPVVLAASGADAAVVATVRPSPVVLARGDDRPHLTVLVALVAPGPSLPALVPASAWADAAYDVRAGIPVEPTSRGPPVVS